MNLTKKLIQILALIFLVLSNASCDKSCVEADEFDVQSLVIESYPLKDGIFGSYDSANGGQRANWHNTDLKSNGDRFLIQIGGSWTSLQGKNQTALNALSRCDSCAKRYDASTPNCICYVGQNPTAEKGIDGVTLNINCSVAANQEDPLKCTCTQQHGLATDYGVYHFPLNLLQKNESLKTADDQTNCKYDRGMGAYIALWGPRGASVPMRAYHLFSEEEICNILRDSQGKCLDAGGNDATRYVFKSANSRIFLKDDGIGNQTIDTDTANDVYHAPNEDVKVIMWDSYYSDNYGQYNVRILRGVGVAGDRGLLEFLVSIVEEVLMGKIGDDDKRHGGIIEFMYKSIIQDSGFVLVVQVSLALYIALFGAAHLFGVAEIASKKELMSRALKIGLIVFFISENSWYFYNKIVVGFFKDSMDYMVAMIMDMYDAEIGQTSMIKIAQMDRAADASNATRFSYVDLVIKNLMSSAVTKKIFGLFFNSIFGFLYIPIIYALIFSFIYVMLYIASMYAVNLIKLIFVLSLGPIFMIFTLFSKTTGMFKNWLAFLGARSLEVIVLFLVLYMFLAVLDKSFTDLLFYRTCGESHSLGLFSIVILMADVDRSFFEWMAKFIGVGGLLFITYMIIQKVPSVAGSLISIGGVKSGSSAGMAGSMMGAGFGLAKQAAGGLGAVAATTARYGIRGATIAARKSGLADALNGVADIIPIRVSPRRLWRDAVIDGAISKATAAAGGKTGKDRDTFIRNTARTELQMMLHSNPNKMAMLGVDMHNISERFDKKLVKDPMKKIIKEEAKKLKGNAASKVKFGKDAQDELKDAVLKRVGKEFYEGAVTVASSYFDKSKGIDNLLKDKAELSSSSAARMLAGDDDAKNRYLTHLMDKQFDQKKDQKWYKPWRLNKLAHGLIRDKMENPEQMAGNFLRKVGREENPTPWHKGNPLAKINFLDKNIFNPTGINKMVADAQGALIRDALMKGVSNQDKAQFLRDKLAQMARGGGTKAGLLAELETANGKSLFEKTAKLAEITHWNTRLDFKSAHEQEIKELMKRQLTAMKTMSNEEAAAERARLTDLSNMSGVSNSVIDAALIARLEQQSKSIATDIDKFSTIDANNIDDAKKASSGLVADKFEVQFGQSVTDALSLKEPDIGLKASNLTLGVATQAQVGKLDESTLNGMKMSKIQCETKLKMEKMNMKIKQFELEKLKQKTDPTDSDKAEIKTLETQVSDTEKDISKSESEVSRIEMIITAAGS